MGGGGGWRKQRAEPGSETVFMVQLGELMALWDRENGKMSGWVRVKICLLKGSCHLPPPACSLTPTFSLCANLLRQSPIRQQVGLCSQWRPRHRADQVACLDQKPHQHSLVRARARHKAFVLREPAMEGWERPMIKEEWTSVCFPSICTHTKNSQRKGDERCPTGRLAGSLSVSAFPWCSAVD